MFKLEIETGNAAFDDGNAAAELARLLHEVARRLEHGDTSGVIWDINGNNVGDFSYEPDDA